MPFSAPSYPIPILVSLCAQPKVRHEMLSVLFPDSEVPTFYMGQVKKLSSLEYFDSCAVIAHHTEITSTNRQVTACIAVLCLSPLLCTVLPIMTRSTSVILSCFHSNVNSF